MEDEKKDLQKMNIVYLPSEPVKRDWMDYAMDGTIILATIVSIAYMCYELYIRRRAMS